MNLGAHISIRDGYYRAAKFASTIGAEVFQYFPKNPRTLTVKDFDQSDAQKCAEYCMDQGIKSVAHTPYPTNLVATGKERDSVIKSLINDLEIADRCGSIGVVVHFGVAKGESDPLEGYRRMIGILDEALDQWNGSCLILIENNAGKSGPVGTTFEELVQVRKLTQNPEKIGFCFDTCHGFASGLWTGDNWGDIEKKGIELDYFEHLKVIHLNNSMYESGSMRDRHANINNGHIQVEQVKEFMLSKIIREIPMVLETPSSRTYSHKDELAYLHHIMN